MKRFALVFLLALFAAGCATPYAPVGGDYQATKWGFEARFPEGWLEVKGAGVGVKDPLYKGIAITREGPLLQIIRVGSMETGETLANTKKSLNEGMLPQEAAGAVADNFRMAEGVLEFNVLENVPAEVGGYPGFKLVLEYKIDKRVWLRRVFYGAIVKDRFYFLQYHAPRRHYYDRDLGTFLKVVESFQPVSAPPAT